STNPLKDLQASPQAMRRSAALHRPPVAARTARSQCSRDIRVREPEFSGFDEKGTRSAETRSAGNAAEAFDEGIRLRRMPRAIADNLVEITTPIRALLGRPSTSCRKPHARHAVDLLAGVITESLATSVRRARCSTA